MTIRPAIQLTAACAGVVFLAASAAFVLMAGVDLRSAATIVAGLALLVPSFLDVRASAGGDDLRRLTRELMRYRRAMFVCFGAALLIYACVTTLPVSNAIVNQLAALGAAFWLVGFALLFFVVYYGSRRAVVQAAQDDDSFE
jgi:hypothetical protein